MHTISHHLSLKVAEAMYFSYFKEATTQKARHVGFFVVIPQDVVCALLGHVGSGLDKEISSALECLVRMTNSNPDLFIPFLPSLKTLAYNIDNFSDVLVSAVHFLTCHLCFYGQRFVKCF